MDKKVVDTLIIDLDNTIFDWFEVWYGTFHPIYERIRILSGKEPDIVDKDIRRVHQERRKSEYSFLIEDINIFDMSERQNENIRDLFKDAISEAQANRDRLLKLYPSVLVSLWEIKKNGTKIVAYTESMAFYSAYRLKRFGLDGVIDVMFSPKDHDVPAGVSLDRLRRRPDEFYELQVTQTRHTPPGELKPNPRVLLDIIQHIGAKPDRCAYVGDSLFKDVAMARDSGVYDIHARYGESQKRPEYNLLQRVSHWTQADVEREAAISRKGADFVPTATLNDSFAEVFMYCDFVEFPKGSRNQALADEHKNAIDIWKKSVDVQQHFNEIEMRIRSISIAVIGALIAAIGVTYQQKLEIMLFWLKMPAGIALIVAGTVAWTGFYFMDKHWYHVLLKGAVVHASKIENKYKEEIPELALGASISEASKNVTIFGRKVDSNKRLSIFYISGYVTLAVIAAMLIFSTASGGSIQGAAPSVDSKPSVQQNTGVRAP